MTDNAVTPTPQVTPSPPPLARALLRRLASASEIEMLDGDLAELFASRAARLGVRRARWHYRRDVLSILIRPLVWATREHDRPLTGDSSVMTMLYEFRHAIRALARQRAFTLTALLVLTLGIGVTTAALTVLNVYLLRPLPFPEPDRLMALATPPFTEVRPPDGIQTIDWRRELPHVFEHVVAWDLDGFTLIGAPYAETLLGAWVTPDYFSVGGVTPALGRTLSAADSRPGAARVAMISYRVWQVRFAGDPAIVGKTITTYSSDRPLEAEIFTIVGVLPRDFWFFAARFTDLLAPLQEGPRTPTFVRLRPNVLPSDGEGAMAAVVARLSPDPRWRIRLVPAAEQHVAQIRPALGVTGAAVALVLLVALANVAMLLMLRALDREREVAIRTALGARRGRLARQLMAESLVLTAAGSALGLLLAHLAFEGLAVSIQQQLRTDVPGGAAALRIDLAVFAQVAGLSVLSGVLLGLVPLAATTGSRILSDMHGGRTMTMSPGRRRLRSGLVAAELAMSLALVVGAALMIQSALHLNRLTVGFDAAQVTKADLQLSIRSYPEPAHRAAVVDRLVAGAASVPGVESATAAFPFPFRPTGRADWERGGGEPQLVDAAEIIAGDRYFETLRIGLRAGRVFAPEDRLGAPRVVIVSDTFAARAWPGANPIGQRIRRPRTGTAQTPGEWLMVVGVVNETRQTLTEPDPSEVYVPYAQQPTRGLSLLVRTAQDVLPLLPSLRAAVERVDPEIALLEPDVLSRIVAASSSPNRFLAVLLGSLAAFASLLAVVGVYGVIAFGLARRQRDIAMRLCLGARRAAIVRMLLGQEGVMVVAGLAGGLGLALALSRAVAGQLHGIQPHDIPTYVMATASLAVVAAIAIVVPAVRTAGLDIMAVFRREP